MRHPHRVDDTVGSYRDKGAELLLSSYTTRVLVVYTYTFVCVCLLLFFCVPSPSARLPVARAPAVHTSNDATAGCSAEYMVNNDEPELVPPKSRASSRVKDSGDMPAQHLDAVEDMSLPRWGEDSAQNDDAPCCMAESVHHGPRPAAFKDSTGLCGRIPLTDRAPSRESYLGDMPAQNSEGNSRRQRQQVDCCWAQTETTRACCSPFPAFLLYCALTVFSLQISPILASRYDNSVGVTLLGGGSCPSSVEDGWWIEDIDDCRVLSGRAQLPNTGGAVAIYGPTGCTTQGYNQPPLGWSGCGGDGRRCWCWSGTRCEHGNGLIPNTPDAKECRCGLKICGLGDTRAGAGPSGYYCNNVTSTCAFGPLCALNTGGEVPNGADCVCGTSNCIWWRTGLYCDASSNACSAGPPCPHDNGSAQNPRDCVCGTTNCVGPITGLYCWAAHNRCAKTSTAFVTQRGSTCGDGSDGKWPVYNQAVCERANLELGNKDLSAGLTDTSGVTLEGGLHTPPGCSVQNPGRALGMRSWESLFFNGNLDAVSKCTTENQLDCICWMGEACFYNDGSEQNDKPCACGKNICTQQQRYCHMSSDTCAVVQDPSWYSNCDNTDGSNPNTVTCQCGNKVCDIYRLFDYCIA